MNKIIQKSFNKSLCLFLLFLATNCIFIKQSKATNGDEISEKGDKISKEDQILFNIFAKMLLAANGIPKESLNRNSLPIAQAISTYFCINNYITEAIKDNVATMENDLDIHPSKHGSKWYKTRYTDGDKSEKYCDPKIYYFVRFLRRLHKHHPNLHLESSAFKTKDEYHTWLINRTIDFMLYKSALKLLKILIMNEKTAQKAAEALSKKMNDIIKKFPEETGYEIEEPILPAFCEEDALCVDGLFDLTFLVIKSGSCDKETLENILKNMILIASRWSGVDAPNSDTWLDIEEQQDSYRKNSLKLFKVLVAAKK